MPYIVKPELESFDWLNNHYIIQGLSCQEIAKMLGVKSGIVHHRLKRFKIPRRRLGNERTGIPNKNKRDLSIYIGRTTDMLEVMGYEDNALICKCKCGNTVKLRTRRITYDKQKSCGCLMHKKGNKNPLWKGGKYVSASYVSHLKNDCGRRNLTFNITLEDIELLFEQQNFKCRLSGEEISFIDNTASVDRIDSKRGYEKDNIQILHRVTNEMKWDYDQQEFIDWCHKVAQANPSTSFLS